MPFTPAPPALVELFERTCPSGPGVSRRKMFGWPAAFVGGNMFAGLHEDRLVLRLAPADLATFLALEGARPFEPMPGRPMKGYAAAPAWLLDREPDLRDWLERALTYGRSLPPKR